MASAPREYHEDVCETCKQHQCQCSSSSEHSSLESSEGCQCPAAKHDADCAKREETVAVAAPAEAQLTKAEILREFVLSARLFLLKSSFADSFARLPEPLHSKLAAYLEQDEAPSDDELVTLLGYCRQTLVAFVDSGVFGELLEAADEARDSGVTDSMDLADLLQITESFGSRNNNTDCVMDEVQGLPMTLNVALGALLKRASATPADWYSLLARLERLVGSQGLKMRK